MLEEKFEEILQGIQQVLAIHRSLPQWFPITKEYAEECGYKSVWGLRQWCYNNLNPDDFVKRGKLWYINVKSLPLVKMKTT